MRRARASGLTTMLAGILLLAGGAAGAGPHEDFLNARTSHANGRFQEAAELLQRAVAQGHQAAMLPLAAMYRDGQGVEQDHLRAAMLFADAARLGYPDAQFSLAAMLRLGQGVRRDYRKAFEWYRRAAVQDHAEAQNSLGVMYEYGRGVRSDRLRAQMWYEIAFASGSRRGNLNRARLARKLPVEQTEKAKVMALACLKHRYREC